jgi:hypothetical protein
MHVDCAARTWMVVTTPPRLLEEEEEEEEEARLGVRLGGLAHEDWVSIPMKVVGARRRSWERAELAPRSTFAGPRGNSPRAPERHWH